MTAGLLRRLGAGAVLALAALGSLVTTALAHAPSFSRVGVALDTTTGTIAVAVHLTPPDLDSDGQISAAEYATAREFLHANSTRWLTLIRAAEPVALEPGEFAESLAEKSLSWKTRVAPASDRPPAGGRLRLDRIEIPVISRLGEGHRAYVEVRRDGQLVTDALLSRHESSLQIETPSTNPPTAVSVSETSAPSAPSSGSNASSESPGRALGFFKLGIEHILTGYDHLLFLAGLILVCRKLRDFVAVVTSFTLAHSVTLALSVIGGLEVPSRLIEPLIAASIVIVGIENILLRRAEPKRRWMPAFAFGLIHGFGFAGALRESGFGEGLASWIPLATFNLGVEAGQLALVLLAMPVFTWLRKQPGRELAAVQYASATVIACGAFWLAQRLGV